MKISTKGRYALRLMVDLAQCKQGENVALKEVAARQGNENTCDRREQCSTLFVWEKLQKAIDDVVDNITLADIIANSADNYVI